MKMRIYIMNSAMMPCDGFYKRRAIDKAELKKILSEATEMVSSVAYPEVQKNIFEATGITIPLDLEKGLTKLEERECRIVVAKLKYRVKSENKGLQAALVDNEYEYFLVSYIKE